MVVVLVVVLLNRNVFCLPGVPELMREQFDALRQKLTCKPLYRQHIQVACDEVDIAHVLSEAQKNFPAVKIGSCTSAIVLAPLPRPHSMPSHTHT